MDKTIEFTQVVDRCCGLDVHKKVIVATVEGTGIARQTREFETTTRSLIELKEWLLELGVTHVAMESTGVYWKPVINILEPTGFTLLVVNAQHIKYVPGHKTDKNDSAWICKLLRAGLLKGSFIPDRAQRDLRNLTRYRRKKVQEVTAEKNRMLKVFEDANLKLSSVFSNLNGVTCTRIIDEILKGNTDPDYLASLCTHSKLQSSKAIPTAANLASWSGVSPGNNESAGKKNSRSHSTRATYYCVPCLEGSGRLLRTWMRIC